ncbi:MAG TPA: glycosyltransferase [Candidatus Methylacidiphilales bacterium]|jgi:glycosyltransferase involved in cell wall biosynthesis|nr:glycosyltransferase [Candidatus Methylacidiphilales bacterium]
MRLVLLGHAPVLGGSTDLLFQAHEYFQRSHEVTVIFGEPPDGPSDPRAKDATILQPRGQNWREDMRARVELVESRRPDIVYSISGERELDIFRFLRCVRVRHVFSLERHGFLDIPFWLTETRGFMEACTANTPDAQEEVRRLTGGPVFLLPYRLPEIDAEREPVVIPASADPGRPLEIAFVGRLERFQKRSHWLPSIVRQCADAGANLHWHIYGDGPEASFLRGKLAAAPNVTLHGWTKRDDLYRQLPRHDILFFCSRWEGLPVAMVEGMRCGLACVAPDIPAGIHWTLSQGGGWLYPATSPRAAARALLEATRDRDQVLQRRREALRLSATLFSAATADAAFAALEETWRTLRYNGRTLDLATAPAFRAIPLSGYARRLGYAAESAAHSPAQFLGRVAQRARKQP